MLEGFKRQFHRIPELVPRGNRRQSLPRGQLRGFKFADQQSEQNPPRESMHSFRNFSDILFQRTVFLQLKLDQNLELGVYHR